MKILWEDKAWEDYIYWQNNEETAVFKINWFIERLKEKVDALIVTQIEGILDIDGENKFAYSIENGVMCIKSCRGIYEN